MKKKVLIIGGSVVAIAVVAALCFVLFATLSGGTSVEDVQEDHMGVLSEALLKTTYTFLEDDNDIFQTAFLALQQGSCEIRCEKNSSTTNLSLNEKVYFNNEEKQLISKTTRIENGEPAGLIMAVDKDGGYIDDNGLIGLNGKYNIEPNAFANGFSSSGFAEFFHLDEDERTDVTALLKAFAKEYAKLFGDDTGDKQHALNKGLEYFTKEIREEAVTNKNGDSVDCIVIKYEITRENIQKALEGIAKEANITNESKKYVEELLEAMSEDWDPNLTAELYIDEDNVTIVKATLSGEYKDIYYGSYYIDPDTGAVVEEETTVYTYPLNVEVNCTDTSIDIFFQTANSSGKKRDYTIDFAKKQDGDMAEYTFKCIYQREGSEPRTEFDLTVSISYDSGDIVITEVDSDGDSDIIMSGSYTVDGDTLEIKLKEESSSSTERSMLIRFVADDEMPKIDKTGAKGIEALDYSQVRAMFRSFDDIFDGF